jgi:hypothetical protein
VLTIPLITAFFAGAAAGAIALAFLAVTEYGRGYDDAIHRRNEWRVELAARRSTSHHARSAA